MMWIFSTLGFFSIVYKHALPRTKRTAPGGFHVRARIRADLERLLDVTWAPVVKLAATNAKVVVLDRPSIVETPLADYPYRVVVDGGQLGALMCAFQETCATYSNFKAAVPRLSPLHGVLHDIWALVRSASRTYRPTEDSCASSASSDTHVQPMKPSPRTKGGRK